MKNPRPKKKRFWVIAFGILSIFLIAPFSAYPLSYQPQVIAQSAYEQATQKQGYYQFLIPFSSVGVIFYPGGLVNPIAYAGFAQTLSSEANASVFVTQPLLNLAITNIEGASAIIKANPNVEHWIIGGHSLGGTSAAFYAIDHLQQIDGIFFLASYTTADADFSQTSLPILTITGANDEILNQETYQAAQIYLSTITTNYVIQGGNHSQFGDYGLQRGDGIATLSQNEQMTETLMVMITWLSVVTLI